MKSKRENMKEFMDKVIKPIIKKYGFYLGGSIILLVILIQPVLSQRDTNTITKRIHINNEYKNNSSKTETLSENFIDELYSGDSTDIEQHDTSTKTNTQPKVQRVVAESSEINDTRKKTEIRQSRHSQQPVNSIQYNKEGEPITLQRNYLEKPKVYGEVTPMLTTIPITQQVRASLLEPLSNQHYGQVVHAVIQDNIKVEDKEIPLKGAQLVGRFYVLRNQNRVFIEFNTLIIDNKPVQIKAVAMDYSDQKRGLIAKVDERVGQRLLEGIVKTATGMLATMTAKTGPLLDETYQVTETLSLDTLETERLVRVEPKQFLLFFDQLAQI